MSAADTQRPFQGYPFLPPELAPIILSQAPDAPTLRNLVLSAPCFYHGFLAEEKSILHAVLWNEFGPAVLPEALALYKSSVPPQLNPDMARAEFFSTTHSKPEIPNDWTLSDSLALAKIHCDVNWFAAEFAETILPPSRKVIPEDCEPPTRNEMDRIRRALFRFELYRTLFPKEPHTFNVGEFDRFDPEEEPKLFFDKFSPWENEQLATIYEFLWNKLSIAFNEVAEHDVLWGKHNIAYDKGCTAPQSNTFKDHCLSLGLAWLRKLAMADTYDQRYQLLAPETGDQYSSFLITTLYDDYDVFKDLVLFEELTEDAIIEHIQPPFTKDPDPGPFTAWLWAYRKSTPAFVYGEYQRLPLRTEGYVMIDYDRLLKRYNLKAPFEPVFNRAADRVEIRNRTEKEVDDSHRRRSEIYDAGGRGYWSEGDESKLIWNVPAIECGMEYILPWRDSWREGILVDRIRNDLYIQKS